MEEDVTWLWLYTLSTVHIKTAIRSILQRSASLQTVVDFVIDFIIRNLVSKQVNQAQLVKSVDTVKTTTENKLQLKRNRGFSFCMAVCMTCGPSMCSHGGYWWKKAARRGPISSSRTSVFLQWHWCAEHNTLVFLDWPRAPRCPMVQGGTGAHRGMLGAGSWELGASPQHNLYSHSDNSRCCNVLHKMSERQTRLRVAVTDWLFPTRRRKKMFFQNASTLCLLPVSPTCYTAVLYGGRRHILSFITRVLSCTVSSCRLFTIGQPGGCE